MSTKVLLTTLYFEESQKKCVFSEITPNNRPTFKHSLYFYCFGNFSLIGFAMFGATSNLVTPSGLVALYNKS